MSNVIALLIKLLLITVILAVYQLVCAYTSMITCFSFNQFFFTVNFIFIFIFYLCANHMLLML